ncbi:hypothetical protein O7614_26525 [Micromonospora sp. WMMD961]|uniref:hypothetical protein n=1 Tax=Micromonospora sp. WMMD961 TaxID=3016100 RepID=UPI00241712AF|nr:hypothetical protein [Micromonospora sp. WMMD961]MDG4783220.1 hypothetical protein [Micromonospora sp. WMMD961]
MSNELLDELLAKPTVTALPGGGLDPERHFTKQVEVSGDTAQVTVRGPAEDVTEDAATAHLRSQGLDPAVWVASGFRSSEWTMANGETGVSARYTYTRAGSPEAERPNLDELFAAIKPYEGLVHESRPQGDHGFLVLLGDMQFGKIDGDGAAGTLDRTIDCLNKAADLYSEYSSRFELGHIHVGWLGDHIEGFVSQGGANVWRTPLTLTEQIRLTRRVMLHALLTFAPMAERVSMAAVPGNHGESVRFGKGGVTRYDDSQDTESLIAVADAAKLAPEQFGHVEFYVPETDELTVTLNVAGTVVTHAHGHQWRPGKHWEWWRGQAFNKASAMHQADLLVAGHLHHEFIDTDGPRTFIQPPAMESESTWWRHAKGTTGAPGLVVAVTKDGNTNLKEVVR